MFAARSFLHIAAFWPIIFLLLSFAAGAESQPSQPADLLFRATFDEAFSAHAVFARGKKECSLTADLGLRGQKGVVKNSLLLEPGETCTYDAADNVNLQLGTISFWIKPVNWESRTIGSTQLFRLSVKGSPFSLSVVKSVSTQKIHAYLSPDDRDLPTAVCVASVGYDKDRWTKLDIAWDDSHLAVYADGRLARETTFSRFKFPERWTSGTLAFTPGASQLRTAVDEIEVFSTRHSPTRVMERYRAVAGADAAPELPPVGVTCVPSLAQQKLGIELRFNDGDAGQRWQPRVGSAQVAIEVAGPDRGKVQRQFPLGPPDQTYWVPVQWSDGDYAIRGELQDQASGEKLPFATSLAKPPMPWLGAKSGVSENVLDPWTPLEYPDDRTVNCWGRSYRFHGPLLADVQSQGQPVLRGPMRLEIETAAGRGAFEETERSVVSRKPNRAEFSGTGRFAGLEGSIRWQSWTEYDGVTFATITLLPPKGGWDVRGLRLSVPLQADVMRYERGREHAPCYAKIAGTSYAIAEFANFLWFANEDRGLLYFCESEANWVCGKESQLIAVDAKDSPGFELRLITAPVRVDKPIVYQIGFEATPVKPLLAGWRAHHFGGSPKTWQGTTDVVYVSSGSARHGLWGPRDPEKLREIAKQHESQGSMPYLYSALGTTPDSNPVYDFFAAEWASPGGPTYGPYEETTQGKKRGKKSGGLQYYMRPIDPGHPAYVDYVTWLAEFTERESGPVSLYTDIFGLPRPTEESLNPHSPFTQTDAFGRTVYNYQFLGIRDYAKRVATIVRKYSRPDRRAYWMGHQHSKLMLPFHGFVDWFYPGEEYTAHVKKSDNPYYYIDELPEEQWRTGFSSQMSGVCHIVLPELARSGVRSKEELNKDPGPAESMIAMCAANDDNLRGVICPESMAEWWGLKARLGIDRDDAQFIAYWRPGCPAKTESPAALASVYRCGNHAVIAVVNKQAKTAEVTVRLDLAALGLAGKDLAAIDQRAGKPLAVQDGRFTVEVRGRNYTYVSLWAKALSRED